MSYDKLGKGYRVSPDLGPGSPHIYNMGAQRDAYMHASAGLQH